MHRRAFLGAMEASLLAAPLAAGAQEAGNQYVTVCVVVTP